MQTLPVYHEFLVEGQTLSECKGKIKRFFDLYELVSYSDIFFLEPMVLRGDHPGFWDRLSTSESVNRDLLRLWLEELGDTGVRSLEDLIHLPQGYPSKLLHTITHILDGFFGVDSYFFNLIEDSHWVSPGLKSLVEKRPNLYWLISVEVTLTYGPQGFEAKAPRNVEI